MQSTENLLLQYKDEKVQFPQNRSTGKFTIRNALGEKDWFSFHIDY